MVRKSWLMFGCCALAVGAHPGCSSRAESREGGRSGGAGMVTAEDRMPGVIHEAYPGAGAPGGTTAGKPPSVAPLPCSQSALEAEAAKALAALVDPVVKTYAEPLLPPLPPHVDAESVTRYAAGAAVRLPGVPASMQSMRATGKVRLRYAPSHDADEVGVLAKGARIPVTGFVGKRGCTAGWLALGPYAYACANRVVPDARPPELIQKPRVPEGQITPGTYGYLRPGGAPAYLSRPEGKGAASRHLPGGFFIRFGQLVKIGPQNYWKTTKGLYVPVERIARHVPSSYHGYLLADDKLSLPLAIVNHEGETKKGVAVYHDPGSAAVVGHLPRYTAASVLGVVTRKSKRGKPVQYYRVGACKWVAARGVRVAWPEKAAPGVRAGERWVDVDLSSQTLVAYEGRKPVFATLVATGKDAHATKHGVFRIYWKVAEVDMSNEMGAEEEYLAEAVPWAMFFWRGQALHGAYWHDAFGRQKSHGCVNLSPRDARWVFEWAQNLPPGWTHSWHGEKFPGTALRIRRERGEEPRILGYARKFAPREEVEARDKAYLGRIAEETIMKLGGDPDEASEAGSTASGTAAPKATAAPRAAVRPRAAAGSGLKSITPPPPPPARRRR